MLNYIKILDDIDFADPDFQMIIGILKWVFSAICTAIPVIIIILIVIDMTKVATAGNVDDKVKKEATQKAATRIIYAIVIFLVPTIVNLIFSLLPQTTTDANGQSKDTLVKCFLDVEVD